MKQRILSKSAEQKKLNDRTLIDGEGNIAGFAGEEIVKAYMPFLKKPAINSVDMYNCDFILPNGVKIDVKSKGNCKFAPRQDYDCTIPMNQKNQKTDFLLFTRISSDLDCGWICGIIKKSNFLQIATVRKAGSPYNNNGRKSIEDHLCCFVKDLRPVHIIKDKYETNDNI